MSTSPSAHRGIGTIEIMIGILIGMIGVAAVFHVLTLAQSQHRTTASGAEAQVSGTIGLFTLEREISRAGFGTGRLGLTHRGCTLVADAKPFLNRPVAIVQDPTGPDAIDLMVGSSPILTDAVAIQSASGSATQLASVVGFFPADVVLAVAPGAAVECAILKVGSGSGAVDASTRTINHAASPFTGGTGAMAVNLGARPRLTRWFVAGDELRVRDMLDATDLNGRSVTAGVVDMRAQYGIDGANGGTIDGSIAEGEWTFTAPASPAEWMRVLGIRVALLARASQYERPQNGKQVTDSAPQWPLARVAFTMPSGTPTDPTRDWRNYRYRVYETEIVLRNSMWGRT